MIARRIPEPTSPGRAAFEHFQFDAGENNPNQLPRGYGDKNFLHFVVAVQISYREIIGRQVPQRCYYLGAVKIAYARNEPQGWWVIISMDGHPLPGVWCRDEAHLHRYLERKLLGK